MEKMTNYQLTWANNMVNQMTIISESAGRISGLATLLRSETRAKKRDSDYLAGELLDISDAINSALAQMRYTIFPCDKTEVNDQ